MYRATLNRLPFEMDSDGLSAATDPAPQSTELITVTTESVEGKSRNYSNLVHQPGLASPEDDVWPLVRQLWPTLTPESDELLRHALREGSESNLFLGGAPHERNPLGVVSPSDASAAGAVVTLFSELAHRESDSDATALSVHALSDPSGVGVSARMDDQLLGAFVYSLDAFLLPLPAGTAGVELVVEASPILNTATGQSHPDVPDWSVLGDESEGDTSIEIVLWRIFTGRNSWVTDLVTRGREGVHQLALGVIGGPAWCAGRVVRIRANLAKRVPKDPTAALRRRGHEKTNAELAWDCPDLRDAGRPPTAAGVVIVHGTMACAMRDASIISSLTALPVARFEHDTWLPVENNAAELVELLEASGLEEVVLISHSRGGLVATLAAQQMHSRVPAVTSIVTLGAPFEGTDTSFAADLAWALKNALIGVAGKALSPLVGGVPVGAMTLLLSTALVGRSPPPGIAEMRLPHTFAFLRRTLPPQTILIGGDARNPRTDYFGGALRTGFAKGVFDASVPNDLVVATQSALAGRSTGVTVDCDHSGYLQTTEVLDLLADIIGPAPRTRASWPTDGRSPRQ